VIDVAGLLTPWRVEKLQIRNLEQDTGIRLRVRGEGKAEVEAGRGKGWGGAAAHLLVLCSQAGPGACCYLWQRPGSLAFTSTTRRYWGRRTPRRLAWR